MQLQDKHIEKYRTIYRKVYHQDISFQEASSQCTDLVIFCNQALKPFNQADLKALEKYR